MESFKEYLMEHWFSKKKPAQAAPEPAARPFSKTAHATAAGFKSTNRSDPAERLSRDTLHSEYNKHRHMRQEHHTDATRARHKELEKEVTRRGGKVRLSPEWHDQHQSVKPKGNIYWKDENNQQHRGY